MIFASLLMAPSAMAGYCTYAGQTGCTRLSEQKPETFNYIGANGRSSSTPATATLKRGGCPGTNAVCTEPWSTYSNQLIKAGRINPATSTSYLTSAGAAYTGDSFLVQTIYVGNSSSTTAGVADYFENFLNSGKPGSGIGYWGNLYGNFISHRKSVTEFKLASAALPANRYNLGSGGAGATLGLYQLPSKTFNPTTNPTVIMTADNAGEQIIRAAVGTPVSDVLYVVIYETRGNSPLVTAKACAAHGAFAKSTTDASKIAFVESFLEMSGHEAACTPQAVRLERDSLQNFNARSLWQPAQAGASTYKSCTDNGLPTDITAATTFTGTQWYGSDNFVTPSHCKNKCASAMPVGPFYYYIQGVTSSPASSTNGVRCLCSSTGSVGIAPATANPSWYQCQRCPSGEGYCGAPAGNVFSVYYADAIENSDKGATYKVYPAFENAPTDPTALAAYRLEKNRRSLVSLLSHEFVEALSDPTGDMSGLSVSGQELGDVCNFIYTIGNGWSNTLNAPNSNYFTAGVGYYNNNFGSFKYLLQDLADISSYATSNQVGDQCKNY